MRHLSPTGYRRAHRTILLGLAAVLILGFGCTERPGDPVFDNPLDPAGPGGGDPFNLSVEAIGNDAQVLWTQPDIPSISSYIVLHRLDDGNFRSRGEVDHLPNTAQNSFRDTLPEPNAINYYKVQAMGTDGTVSAFSRVAEFAFAMPPYLVIAEGASSTPTRFVTLTITTSLDTIAVGDFVEIADNENFEDPTVIPLDPPKAATELEVAWDLGTSSGNNDIKSVHARVLNGPDTSVVAHQDIRVSFDPEFSILSGESGVTTQVVDLEIESLGVEWMAFAASEAELPGTPDVPGDSLFTDYTLTANPNPQEIWAEFISDFGFSETKWIIAEPADLSGASFAVESLTGDDEITENRQVNLIGNANASRMRYTEGPDFAGVPWVAFQDTFLFTLSQGAGQKILYGQFGHFWAETPVVSDWITLVDQAVDVGFLFPPTGGLVRGGTQITVQGFAATADLTPLDEVQVNLGTAGFLPPVGLQEWSLVWDVPLLDGDTAWTLTARAVAAEDTALALRTVTITQLVATITSPAAGDQLKGGMVVEIAGTAAGIQGGAPLDSVTVDLAGSPTVASGLEAWSLEWTVPKVTESFETFLRAIAWAGGEAAADTVAVTLVPAD